jgi:hypothetical protein
MGFLHRSRRKQLVELYSKLQSSNSWEYGIEAILANHPKLEFYEAALVSAYLESEKTSKEFDKALRELGVK